MDCKNNKKRHASLFDSWNENWCNTVVEDKCCNKKHKDCEESSCICCREHDEVLGYVSFNAPTTSGIVFPAGSTIPLNNTVFAQNIGVSPIGGLVISKAGNYGITFNVTLTTPITSAVTFEIYANSRLIASISGVSGASVVKGAKIAYLAKNEVLQVKTPTGVSLYDANLTAAKLN